MRSFAPRTQEQDAFKSNRASRSIFLFSRICATPSDSTWLQNALRTTTLAAFFVAVPFAGAYAAGDSPSAAAFADQVQGVENGIADARQQNKITSAEAQKLHTQAAQISQAAESIAAADHGSMPAEQYRQLLGRLDNVDQALMVDIGNGFAINDNSHD